MEFLTSRIKQYLSDPQVVILGVFLIVGTLLVIGLGKYLTPVIAALVIAYLLEGVVGRLERRGVPRLLGTLLVLAAFVVVLVFILFGLAPLVSRQVAQLVQQLPTWVSMGRDALMQLPEKYPQFITQGQVEGFIDSLGNELALAGQRAVTWSLASVSNAITLVIYLVIVPIMVLFFLKDKLLMLEWLGHYLPRERELTNRVFRKVDLQIGNYIRGKALEILIVYAVSQLVFSLMGLQFATLLAVVVGLSVIVPFIGAAVVTIPVALVAYFQWGASMEFVWLMVAYLIVQVLDGNVLVPVLFSEVVDLHPIAIIVAVLLFGGLWGFWGVFFAIPLATLVQAVLQALPAFDKDEQPPPDAPAL